MLARLSELRYRGSEHRPASTGSRELARALSRDVSRAMVNLLKDYNGRGASHAQAYIHEDLVVVVLRRTMTKAERTLADEGEEALVRGVRRVLQGKFREDANGIVERLTGQHVSAFLSDHDVDEDVVVQAFVLEPGPRPAFSQGPVEVA
jgi:uncharacterized protein YbcI